MKRAAVVLLPVLAALLGLAGPLAAAPAARPARKPRGPQAKTFEVCRHGCRYRAIQEAVDAAGAFAFKHRGAKVKVAIAPGRYVGGVVIDGTARHRDFDRMTIEGIDPGRKRTVLEGTGAVPDGIEATGVDGLALANMWARGFGSSGFLVRSSDVGGKDCDGYTMSNLLASGNGSDGIAAVGCLGGRILESAVFRQGGAGFHIAETPCDQSGWSVYDGTPCQAEPRYTLLRDDQSHENFLGYSGSGAKYVAILESAFFDNGAGIVDASADGAASGPGGWNVIERDDVFWNDYNPFLSGAAFSVAAGGLGELDGLALNYPTGVGIALAGTDGDLVRGNHVFGNYKWGIASFSGPGEAARNVDNEVVGNLMGRAGADPNGEYDFWNDATGGGNCWGANSSNSTFAPGNGKVPPGQIYPICPQAPVAYATAKSTNLTAGLQAASLTEVEGRPATLVGYASTDPPQDQQCSWVQRLASHPPFQRFEPAELTPAPGELTCDRS